jgi:hypothetical protein
VSEQRERGTWRAEAADDHGAWWMRLSELRGIVGAGEELRRIGVGEQLIGDVSAEIGVGLDDEDRLSGSRHAPAL